MYRRSALAGAIVAVAVTTVLTAGANAQQFQANLTGFQELGPLNNQTGAILTNGQGTLTLNLNKKLQSATYTLTYSNVGTTAPQTGTVSQAHIHFGKSRDSGGILVFFCTNLAFHGTGPTPQACPANSGTVSGMWTQSNVQAITGQNVVAGDFSALVGALESDTAYANVHTIPLTGGTNTAFPGGEIRGQIRQSEDQQGNQNQQ